MKSLESSKKEIREVAYYFKGKITQMDYDLNQATKRTLKDGEESREAFRFMHEAINMASKQGKNTQDCTITSTKQGKIVQAKTG